MSREKTYIVDDEAKTIQLIRRLTPLMLHAKFVERLRVQYPGYTIIPPAK